MNILQRFLLEKKTLHISRVDLLVTEGGLKLGQTVLWRVRIEALSSY
jgi:hypothetical protein